MRISALLAASVALVLAIFSLGTATPLQAVRPTTPLAAEIFRDFDVVIAGGTTVAESGARSALIEPTEWVGGQLTASAVPAVDEASHKVTDPKTKEVLNVSVIARKGANKTPNFRDMLDATGNPGGGWVSLYCFQPKDFLEQHLLPLEEKLKEKLVVFRDTVVKSVGTDPASGRITSIIAIKRTPKPASAGMATIAPSRKTSRTGIPRRIQPGSRKKS
jgi:hypothetical protein